MTLHAAVGVVAMVMTVGSLTVREEAQTAADRFPVTIENCGVSTTYAEPPRRVVTMNQAATELLLELGLQDRLVGTAYLDDAILPRLAGIYRRVPVLSRTYPSPEALFAVRPDLVFAAYASAFTDEGVGARIGTVTQPPTVFWYDAGSPPSVGACCGMPNEILRLVGARNVFDDKPGSWTSVSWNDVIDRNPDVIVLVDAPWSPAADKARWLSGSPEYARIEAVSRQRFVTIDFSSTTPGIRTMAAVRRLAEALYPDKFTEVEVAVGESR